MQEDFMLAASSADGIYVDTKEYKRARLILDGPVGSPEQYRDYFNVLEMARHGDLIELHICTDGGNLDTTLLFIAAIQKCEADVIGFVGPNCHSAGSFISMYCDSIVVNDYATMLVHTSFGGLVGAPIDNLRQAELQSKLMEKLLRNSYSGFLTEAELLAVMDNKQMFLSSDEIKERWAVKIKYNEEAAIAAEELANKPKPKPRAVRKTSNAKA